MVADGYMVPSAVSGVLAHVTCPPGLDGVLDVTSSHLMGAVARPFCESHALSAPEPPAD